MLANVWTLAGSRQRLAIKFLSAQPAELDQIGRLPTGVGTDVDRAAVRIDTDDLWILDGDLTGVRAIRFPESDHAIGGRIRHVYEPLRDGQAARRAQQFLRSVVLTARPIELAQKHFRPVARCHINAKHARQRLGLLEITEARRQPGEVDVPVVGADRQTRPLGPEVITLARQSQFLDLRQQRRAEERVIRNSAVGIDGDQRWAFDQPIDSPARIDGGARELWHIAAAHADAIGIKAKRLEVVDMRHQIPRRRLKHAERPDFLCRDIRRERHQHLPMRAVAVVDLDLVPALVAVDRAVAMKDIQRPARPDRDTTNRPTYFRHLHTRSITPSHPCPPLP